MSGDGAGGTEEEISKQTGDACVKACVEQKRNEDSINGVTVRKDGGGSCFCEKGMNRIPASGSSTYKTCYLRETTSKKNCKFPIMIKNML